MTEFRSDHRLIQTVISLAPDRQVGLRFKWSQTMVDEFRDTVDEGLKALFLPDLSTKAGIDEYLAQITKVLETAVKVRFLSSILPTFNLLPDSGDTIQPVAPHRTRHQPSSRSKH